MKKLYLIIILCFITIQSVMSQSILREKFVVTKKEGTLKEVLQSLSKENGIAFSYASNVVDNSKKVMLPDSYNKLEEILPYLFDNKTINYKVTNRRVIIFLNKTKSKKQSNYIHLKGTIIDRKSNQTLPFVAIQLKNQFTGGVSGEDGKFKFKFQKKQLNDTLVFSCLGYVNNEIAIKKLIEKKEQTVKMQEYVVPLKEVSVKPKPALDIVKAAMAAIPRNYPQRKYQFEAFYRNLVEKDGKYIRLTEAVCNFQSASYDGKVDKYERQKEHYKYSDANFNSPLYDGPFTNSSVFADLFDTHIAKEDKVEIIESRISQDHSRTLTPLYSTGGPLTCIATDKVKFRTDFLNPKKYKYSRYKYIGVTNCNGREVYVISFKPKRFQFRRKENEYRQKSWKHKFKNAEFTGKLYIDTRSLAFVKIEQQVREKKWCPGNKTIVNYKLVNGKWFLSEVTKNLYDTRKGVILVPSYGDYKITSKLTVSSIDTLTEKELDSTKCKPYYCLYSFYLDEHEYNPEFWKNYNVILPSEEEEKIKKDLSKRLTLEQQFNLAGKCDSTLCLPKAYESIEIDTIHGDIMKDPYKWLEEKDDEKVVDFLLDQSIYADNYAFQYKEEQKKIKTNISKWVQPTKVSEMFTIGEYSYYEKQLEDKAYECVFRTKNAKEAKEELIFDVNKLAETRPTFNWLGYDISGSGNKLAFMSNNDGTDSYLLQFKDISKDAILKGSLKNAIFLSWNNNEDAVFYLQLKGSQIANKIFKHKIGNPQNKDVLIFEEKNKNYTLMPIISEENKYITFNSSGFLENAVLLYDMKKGKTDTVFALKEG